MLPACYRKRSLQRKKRIKDVLAIGADRTEQTGVFKVSPFHAATILVLLALNDDQARSIRNGRGVMFETRAGDQSTIRMRVAWKVVSGA